MKKFIAFVAGILAFAAVASAQPRAIGVRAGWPVGELSYQQSMSDNFMEFDLGWFNNGFNLVGVYDFVFASANIFNFYIGPGAQIGLYRYKDTNGDVMKFNLGVVAQLGVEAEIPSIPLNISLDWRPTVFAIGGSYWGGVALGIRYRF